MCLQVLLYRCFLHLGGWDVEQDYTEEKFCHLHTRRRGRVFHHVVTLINVILFCFRFLFHPEFSTVSPQNKYRTVRLLNWWRLYRRIVWRLLPISLKISITHKGRDVMDSRRHKVSYTKSGCNSRYPDTWHIVIEFESFNKRYENGQKFNPH